MRILKLLILAALCLTSIGAMAEIVDGVRQRPNVVKAETFQTNVTFYLFNTKARMFFVGANDWNTRASIGTKGYKVKIVQSDFASEGSFEFTDSVETQNTWKSVYSTDDAGAIWVDNYSDATYRFWEFTEKDGKYRISNSELAIVADAANDKFLGWNGTDDTRLYFVDPATAGVGVDWVFVTEETYDAWQETWKGMKDQFEAAAELLTYLKQAEKQNVSVNAEQGVYNNEAATVEEINAAILAVQKKIAEALSSNATMDNPADMTGSLMNPNFDGHSAEGWKGDKPGFGNNPHPAAEVAEFYGKDKYDVYQELNGMPAGVYQLSANAYNRGAWEGHAEKKDYVVYLYAQADNDTVKSTVMNAWDAMNTEPLEGATSFGTTATQEAQTHDGVTYYIPFDLSATRVAFDRGFYQNSLYFMVEEGSVRLGIRKDKKIYDWDWECMDNFKLTYFGKAADAYLFYFSKAAPEKQKYSVADVSKQYLDAYDAAYTQTVSNKAEAMAAIVAINAAADSLNKNVSLWNEMQEAFEEAEQYTIGKYDGLDAAATLKSFSFNLKNDVINVIEKEQSNAELQILIDKITEMVEAVKEEYKNLPAYYLKVANLNIKAGESNKQEISLKNENTNLVGFQMDLTLPDGIGIDKTGCSLSSRITDENQELIIGKLESGVYRITSTSLSLTPISDNNGTLLSLKLTAEDDCVGGQATISNVLFSTSESEKIIKNDKTFDISILYNLTYKVDGQEYKDTCVAYGSELTPEAEPTKEGNTFGGWSEIPETMPNHDVEITGRFYIYGDVNTDEDVDVVDVVDIARFVVATPSVSFREKLADLNKDNTVNIADAVALVNHIVGDQNFARAMTPSKPYNYNLCQIQLLSTQKNALSLCLDGDADFTAFQFEVELPENTDITAMRVNGQRKNDHQLLYNKVAANRYRVAVLSLSNSVFKGNEGELLNISIDGLPTDEISVNNILFVTKNGTGITFNGLSLSGTVTGIANIDANEGNNTIFDLQGRKLSKVQRSINIVNGRKVFVNK